MTTARLRQWWADLRTSFWLRPSVMTVLAIALAMTLVDIQERITPPEWLQGWIYGGGADGAREVLSAIATAMIGVVGSMFSITVAALTLASNQMGPRLLRNFTRDAGNQYALGALVATFAFALVVLRSVQSTSGQTFIPQWGVSSALLLSMICVGIVIWFLQHLANSINVDRVIALVYSDLQKVLRTLPSSEDDDALDEPGLPRDDEGMALHAPGSGYVLVLDDDTLADWAGPRNATLRLTIRPGDFVFPYQTIGTVWPARAADEAKPVLARALAFGEARDIEQDIEFAVTKLVEIGLRALSPSMNDPFTAMSVLARLGAALSLLSDRRLPDGRTRRAGRLCVERPATGYAGLLDAMFHMIRQSAAAVAPVIIRMQEVFCAVILIEQHPDRRAELRRHAVLAHNAALAALHDDAARMDIKERHARITAALAERQHLNCAIEPDHADP